MRKTVTSLAVLMLTALFTLMQTSSTVTVDASTLRDDDPIVGGWQWTWTNNRDYTKAQCPGGSGMMTITVANGKKTISFKGKYRTTDNKEVEFSNTGSWEFAGEDPNQYNRRKYRLKWSNDTDTVVLSDAGNFLVGTNGNGSCKVTGAKG